MKLDIGSGPKPAKGYVTLDCRGNPDIMADLEDAEGLLCAVRGAYMVAFLFPHVRVAIVVVGVLSPATPAT
jgi:hypothetical protein